MQQIAQHPWAKGLVLTQGELTDEFKTRKEKIDEERKNTEMEKERKKAMRADAVDNRTAFVRGEETVDPQLKLFLENYE